MADHISAGQAAEAIGTTGTRLRVFLRASNDYQACGSGKRYTFTPDDLPKLKERFHAWATADDSKRAERKARIEAERVAKADAPGEPTATPQDLDLSEEGAPEPSFAVGQTKGSKVVHHVVGDQLACGKDRPKNLVIKSTDDAAVITCSACVAQLSAAA